MKTKYLRPVAITYIVFTTIRCTIAQGTFHNFDFEAATVPAVLQGQFGGIVTVADGIPFWKAYERFAGEKTSSIFYNVPGLGGPILIVHGPESDLPKILAGDYSLELYAGPGQVAIGQIGQIPDDARSLSFYASPGSILNLSFAGKELPYVQLASRGSYISSALTSRLMPERAESSFSRRRAHLLEGQSIIFNSQPS